jgi:hypothetical protein
MNFERSGMIPVAKLCKFVMMVYKYKYSGYYLLFCISFKTLSFRDWRLSPIAGDRD